MPATMAKRSRKESKPPKRSGPRECFHMPPEMHAALLKYVADQELETDKSAVLRLALQRYLADVGYWPPKAPQPNA